MKTFENFLMLLGRIGLSLIFFYMAYDGITHWNNKLAEYHAMGVPQPSMALFGASIVQFFGAISLALGFKVRWGAAGLALFLVLFGFREVIAGNMNAAETIHCLKNAGIFGGLLFVYVNGPGSLSIGK